MTRAYRDSTVLRDLAHQQSYLNKTFRSLQEKATRKICLACIAMANSLQQFSIQLINGIVPVLERVS